MEMIKGMYSRHGSSTGKASIPPYLDSSAIELANFTHRHPSPAHLRPARSFPGTDLVASNPYRNLARERNAAIESHETPKKRLTPSKCLMALAKDAASHVAGRQRSPRERPERMSTMVRVKWAPIDAANVLFEHAYRGVPGVRRLLRRSLASFCVDGSELRLNARYMPKGPIVTAWQKGIAALTGEHIGRLRDASFSLAEFSLHFELKLSWRHRNPGAVFRFLPRKQSVADRLVDIDNHVELLLRELRHELKEEGITTMTLHGLANIAFGLVSFLHAPKDQDHPPHATNCTACAWTSAGLTTTEMMTFRAKKGKGNLDENLEKSVPTKESEHLMRALEEEFDENAGEIQGLAEQMDGAGRERCYSW